MKSIIKVFAGILVLSLLLGCIGEEKEEATYTFTISGLTEGELTLKELKLMPSEEFDAVLVKSTGTEIENSWKGVLLSDALEKYDLSPDYITFVAQDGYMSTVKWKDLTNAYLCYEMDGEQITQEDGGPIRLVITDQPGKLWLKFLKEIKLLGKENALVIKGKTKVTLVLPPEDLTGLFDQKTVTAEYKGEEQTFEGVPLVALLNRARYEDDAATVRFTASDGYTVEVPFDEAFGNENILVTEEFRLVMPGYESKYWIKGLCEIELL
ncbi:MAG: molybdopterin-dependent oxidoreductase [Euryarchaeota archaeon]|nr:molybdopterin-dependent oxidoreductase [Euryarchaeota archaeon]